MDKQGVPNRDANAAQRAATATSLRARRLTYQAIAEQCGYGSASACRKAIQRELQRVVVTNVDELRREELAMLDKLHTECWDLAMDKGYKGRLFAVDRLLAISERRAKLLGMDAPTTGAIAAAQVVIREVPAGYLGEAKV